MSFLRICQCCLIALTSELQWDEMGTYFCHDFSDWFLQGHRIYRCSYFVRHLTRSKRQEYSWWYLVTHAGEFRITDYANNFEQLASRHRCCHRVFGHPKSLSYRIDRWEIFAGKRLIYNHVIRIFHYQTATYQDRHTHSV